MDFTSLEESFEGSESVYDSETNIKKADASLVFKIALSDDATKFLKELTQTNVQNSQSFIINKPTWKIVNTKNMDNNNFKMIKQRQINIRLNDNTFTFFTKKNVNTNITQKLFLTKSNKYIIFSVIKTIIDGKLADFKIIDKMTLNSKHDSNNNNNNDNDNNWSVINNETNVKIDGRIIWSNSQNVQQTVMRSKWFRYYQSRFETWRGLMNKNIEKYYNDIDSEKLIKPFTGKWNKLNSFFEIKISKNEIIYHDGSVFTLELLKKNKNELYIKAKYGDSYFEGKFDKNNKEILRWNNGSHWIKNGFKKFEGIYIENNTKIKIKISDKGYIKFDNNKNKKYEFMLIGKRSIAYHKDLKAIKGTINNDGTIKWDNNKVWMKQVKKNNIETKTVKNEVTGTTLVKNSITNKDKNSNSVCDSNTQKKTDKEIVKPKTNVKTDDTKINADTITTSITAPIKTVIKVTAHDTAKELLKTSNVAASVCEDRVTQNSANLDDFKDDDYGQISANLTIKIEKIDHFVHVNDEIQKSKILDENDTVIINKLHSPYVSDMDNHNNDDYDWQLIDVESHTRM